MSHYGISNAKTTAGNFAAKASYFEKKLKELKALQDKRLTLGADRGLANEVMAEELARVDAEIARVVGEVESSEQGTGREDYYHKSGNDTLASNVSGPLGKHLGLGDRPQDGDYLALFRGINPRTGECFLGDSRQKQIDESIARAEALARDRKEGKSTRDRLSLNEADTQAAEQKKEKDKDQVLGFSSCVSMQKSLSLYWAKADEDTRRVIQECWMQAVDDAIQYEHDNGRIRGREKAQGAESVRGESVALTYLHCTARRTPGAEFPDPQIHAHVERPNFVMLPGGKFTTLDAGHLYKTQREFGAVVDVSFFQRIQERLPQLASATVVDWAGHGLRLNDRSVSRQTVEEFSKRSQQISAEKKNLAVSGQGATQAVAMRSRDGKDVALGEGLDLHWRESIPTIELHASTEEERKAPTLLEVQQMLFRGESVVEEYSIDVVAAQLTVGRGGVRAIAQRKDQLFKQLGLVEIPQQPDEKGRVPGKRYTTKEMILLEADCLKAVYAGMNDPRWKLDRASVDEVIARYEAEKHNKQKPGEKPFSLTDEQRNALYALTDVGQFSFLKGAAGVGKSATLAPMFRAYNDAFKAEGRRIMGVAPGNKQATELQASTGIQSQTVHSLLIKHQEALAAKSTGKQHKASSLIRSGDIIVCDEAGMLDTYTMHSLVVACHQAGARLLCAGDRNQHGAVATASLFGLMHDAVEDRVARIETIARQVPEFRPIAQAFYEGKSAEAIAMMDAKDQLRIFRDGVNEADQLVQEALADMKNGQPGKDGIVRELCWNDVLILADTNEQVRSLNDKVREERFARGELSLDPASRVKIETEVLGGQLLSLDVGIGDRLLLRENAKDAESQPIFNGDLGTVLAFRKVTRDIDGERIEDMEFTVARDDGKTVKILTSEYRALQHGYAMTSTKAQGMTVSQTFYLPSQMASLQSLYVSYTRGIYGAKVYLNEVNWADFKKATEQYRYKQNALDLMPQVREAIRSTVQTGQSLTLKAQTLSVLVRLQGSSERFQFSEHTLASEPRVRSVQVLSPVDDEIALAKAFGRGIVDLREDGQAWPIKKASVAVIAPNNPPIGVSVPVWKNPGTSVPAENRPDLVQNLEAIQPALFTPKLKIIKPVPLEVSYVRRNDPAGSAPFATLGRYPRVDGRATASGDGIPQSRSQSVAGSLGRFERRAGADGGAAANAEEFARPIGNFERPSGRAAGDGLRTLSSCNLAASAGGRREGVLPGNALADRQAVGGVRRTIPGAEVIDRREHRTMKFDKAADAREVSAMKRDVDLVEYANSLGMEYDKKASYKGHAVFRHAGGKYDIYQAPDENWVWHDRHGNRTGDIFKLFQEVKGGSFAEAKEDVRAFLGVLPSYGASAEEQARIDRDREIKRQAKEQARAEEIKKGTTDAYRTFGLMSRRDNYLASERGISAEVLVETRWKSSRYGSAVFPHINAEGRFSGFEYRGLEITRGKGEEHRKEHKGFSKDTEKGIYLANPKCLNPTEIRFSEGGVDTLSAYQLASLEERQRILFVGTTGEPGPNTEGAITALAKKYNIKHFSLAYDRDQGGDNLTVKRHARLDGQFPGAQIEDVRERIGLLTGEDPNEALKRIEAMSPLRKVQKFETVAPTAPTPRLVAQPEIQPSHDEDEATQSHGRSI